MEQQKDKVVELANKLIEIIDDKNGWERRKRMTKQPTPAL